jgi:hypothetical protein
MHDGQNAAVFRKVFKILVVVTDLENPLLTLKLNGSKVMLTIFRKGDRSCSLGLALVHSCIADNYRPLARHSVVQLLDTLQQCGLALAVALARTQGLAHKS